MGPARRQREMLAKMAEGCLTATKRKEVEDGAAAQRGGEEKGIRISIMRCSFWAFGSFVLRFSERKKEGNSAISRRAGVSGTSWQFGYRDMVKNLVASLFTHSWD